MAQEKSPIDDLRNVSRPILYQTHIKDAPFAIWGTGFLVGYGGDTFIATASHVVRDCPTPDVLVFPSDRSKVPFHLTDRITFEEEPDDPDSTDVVLFKVPIKQVPKKDQRRSRVIDLNNPQSPNWQSTRLNSEFFLIGYPQTGTSADYEAKIATTTQYLLSGQYLGRATPIGCHQLQLRNLTSLESFDGLSGSPVFSAQKDIGIGHIPKFCGMLIRAGAESGKGYFLEAETIMLLLENA